jgi:meiotic recombination protein REC8, fungi type
VVRTRISVSYPIRISPPVLDPLSRSGVVDDDYNPFEEPRIKRRTRPNPLSATDESRADFCTLKENHEHLLSGSFDSSFLDEGLGCDISSSQIGSGVFDGDFHPDILTGISDELALELGEGWGLAPPAGDK